MMTPESQRALEDRRRLLVLIWAGFLACLLVYLVLPWFVAFSEVFLDGGSFPGVSRTGLWAVAFLIVGFLWWWDERWLTREALLNHDRFTWGTLASNYAAKKIVGFALAEAVAIYGLLLALIGQYLWDQLLLSGVSGALLIRLYPSRAFFDQLVRDAELARSSSALG